MLWSAGLSAAEAAKGMASGAEMAGYGRIIFNFDGEVGAKARIVNSVLIVEFDQTITVDVDKLSQQLPNYVSVVRLDPDGRSVRLALNERYRTDLKLAGEKVFVDILSNRWQGSPPPLPQEVVMELVRRARVAEDQLRKIAREQEKNTNKALDLKLGTAPQFRRAIFTMPRTAPASFQIKDDAIVLDFDAEFTLAEPMAREKLAEVARDLDIEAQGDHLRVTLVPREGLKVRGFREDDSLTFDFTRADGKTFDDASAPAPAAAAPAPKDKAAKEATGKETSGKEGAGKPVPAPEKKAEAPVAPANPPATPPATVARAEPSLVPPALEQAAARQQAMPGIRVENGRDAQGFALRLSNVAQAPLAIVQRGNQLLVLVEGNEPMRAPAVPQALQAKVESLTAQPLKGASLLRFASAAPGAYWLRREGDDVVIERGASGGTPEAFSGTTIDLERAYDDSGRDALEAKLGARGTPFVVDDPASGARLTLAGTVGAAQMSPQALAFAEFSLQPTLAGLAVLPLDEALTVRRRGEGVVIGHEIKLNISPLAPEGVSVAAKDQPLLLDIGGWAEDRAGDIRKREHQLITAAAEAPRVTRSAARLRLVKYYLANALYSEADAVLSVLMADDPKAPGDKRVNYYKAFAAAMMGRTVEATRRLSEPQLATEPEGRLLMGYVETRGQRYPQALASFKSALGALDRYPESLQGQMRRAAIEAGVEADDPAFAQEQLSAYAKLPVGVRDPHLQQLLAARLADQQGRPDDALAAYALAAQSHDREIEAEARFGKAVASLALNKMAPEDARAEFETIGMIWRRSDVEVKALEKLGNIYASEGRWREAFLASQRATGIMPEHVAARRLEDTMARRFETLFLRNEGEKLSKIETLALYQEFRQLVPVGRRGDEIARHLAERLLDLDLPGEASAILEHQIKHRLEGVARAAVAARLAVIQLSARQPAQALSTLRSTRLAVMPDELRRARQLLESRALGELYRTDLAIELVADEKGEDVDRLRADIYWKGKKWREAGEAYERLLGDTWQQKTPLEAGQRLDALRAGLAYTLGDEKLALDRLRGRYLPAMSKTEDAAAFNLVTNDKFARPQDFRDVARAIVNADTLTEFMAAYRKRYPESGGAARPVRSAGDGRQSNANTAIPPEQPMPPAKG